MLVNRTTTLKRLLFPPSARGIRPVTKHAPRNRVQAQWTVCRGRLPCVAADPSVGVPVQWHRNRRRPRSASYKRDITLAFTTCRFVNTNEPSTIHAGFKHSHFLFCFLDKSLSFCVMRIDSYLSSHDGLLSQTWAETTSLVTTHFWSLTNAMAFCPK